MDTESIREAIRRDIDLTSDLGGTVTDPSLNHESVKLYYGILSKKVQNLCPELESGRLRHVIGD
jgi:hypothetical protein